jgi:hypothetical protein
MDPIVVPRRELRPKPEFDLAPIQFHILLRSKSCGKSHEPACSVKSCTAAAVTGDKIFCRQRRVAPGANQR